MARWKADENLRIWVHITGALTNDLQDTLRTQFSLHRLALQDASRDRHPPKIEQFGGHTFLLLKSLTATTTDTNFATLQSIMFVGERFLVTRTSAEAARPSGRFWEKDTDHPPPLGRGPDAITAQPSMRLSTDRYLGDSPPSWKPCLESLEQGVLDRVDDAASRR